MYLFLAFLLVPLIEIGLFIKVGGLIGLWPTLGIVILTAILGTSLVRSQGFRELGRLQRSFETLDNPAEPLANGAMILLAGALLLTPGFFTDAVGFALLVPGVRAAVIRRFAGQVRVGGFGPAPRRPGFGGADIIDGEFEEVDPAPRRSGRSGQLRDINRH